MQTVLRMVGLALLGALTVASRVEATSLQAMPVLIEMPNGANTSSVMVRNVGRAAFDVQTRIFRWRQIEGRDILEETEDVATSPPVTTLRPGSTYSVRIVRLDGKPVQREESFRILVDQLPDGEKMRDGVVSLVMRHSIPVFVAPVSTGAPKLDWSLHTANGRLVLQVRNAGGRRVRLSGVSVTVNGRKIAFGKGLLGYVLAGSTMEWSASSGSATPTGQAARIEATTDIGPLNVSARVRR